MTKERKSPYIGPRPFQKEDQELFFGRNFESKQIVARIFANQVVLIYGASGVGKSSILNAQIIPILQENGFEVIPPVHRIMFAVAPNITDQSTAVHNLYIFNAMQSLCPMVHPESLINKSFSQFLDTHFPHNYRLGRTLPRVIIFDQLEELFKISTERREEQQKDFFTQIADALIDPDNSVVLVIREEYLAELEPFIQKLPGRPRSRFRLHRLNKEAASDAIMRPIQNTTLSFDEGVVEKFIADLMKIRSESTHGIVETLVDYVEPVQLQIACQRLWYKAIEEGSNKISIHQLEVINQSLKELYEQTIKDVVTSSKIREEEIRNWCEKKLITSTQTKGIVYRDQYSTADMHNAVIDILENHYLIRSVLRSGARFYELTDDRLIKPIIESNREWYYNRKNGHRNAFYKYFSRKS